MFQSTRPVRGATWELLCSLRTPLFQSTRPVRGATRTRSGRQPARWGFNPRAPYGARQEPRRQRPRRRLFQSTRPVRGATPLVGQLMCIRVFQSTRSNSGGLSPCLFQSTRPVRGATCHRRNRRSAPVFQSTRPVRGATLLQAFQREGIAFQSTRPVRGATIEAISAQPFDAKFQSTRPVRGATLDRCASTILSRFQSTRPVRGATSMASLCMQQHSVSIHAPRTGRDWSIRPSCASLGTFQSTRPVRGATSVAAQLSRIEMFQSTRPVRGATRSGFSSRYDRIVSIHAPRTGRDARPARSWPRRCRFNPRAPYGARPRMLLMGLLGELFQSTRPVRGATRKVLKRLDRDEFQSTRPVRGATSREVAGLGDRVVSIHAPRTGRDWQRSSPAAP